jgi:Predicted archaeal methyltransferase
MRIDRVWSMPNKYTFKIPIIHTLLSEEMIGSDWADPFAGMFSPAKFTNDCNYNMPTTNHLDGLDFLKCFESAVLDGVIFDPPYSAEQALRKYKAQFKGTAGRAEYWARCLDEAARIIKPGGKLICFGWSSNGAGKGRGFKLLRLLVVAHGACHPMDTLVTVELKISASDEPQGEPCR